MVYSRKTKNRDMYIGARPELFGLAKEKRAKSTEAEKILWKALRKFRSEGYAFRRQHPIDLYIADFYCHRLKLVIEVDGEYHLDKEAAEYEDARSGEIERFDVKIIRFTNDQVINDIEIVLTKIRTFFV